MELENRYQSSWRNREVGEAEPASEAIYRVILSHLNGSGRTVFSTRELRDEMPQPYSFEQVHASLELGGEVEMLEEDTNLWLYTGQV
ncbi:MAG: hypothetical protein ABEJ91_00445 [Candidatus Nanohaloarchaea archaeon]